MAGLDLILEKKRLLQADRCAYIKNEALKGPWITLIRLESHNDGLSMFCALTAKARRTALLEDGGWELRIGDGGPSISTSYGPNGAKHEYSRFANDGIEPLIYRRSFYGGQTAYNELSEEFRLFHNLYYDEKRRVYLHFNGEGQEEVAAEISETTVRVKLRLLVDFLAVKQMDFVLFFEGNYWSKATREDLGVTDDENFSERTETLCMDFHTADTRGHFVDDNCLSRLLGKVLLICPTYGVPDPSANSADETFSDFIVDIDEHGKPVRNTCNPAKLRNNFGLNPDALHYLTPVHFRREVLQKYYDNPQSYSVSDGVVKCGAYWHLRLDNDHPDRVIVFLGDLGTDIGQSERLHWLHYNIPPEGGLSKTGYTRSIRGWFADPASPELVFKREYERVNKLWEQREGWPMFLPMKPDDAHLPKVIRVPLAENQAEFDGVVLALTKLLIDSMNEKEIQKGLTLNPGDKGITKLEKFFASRGVPDPTGEVKYLRNLQDLRAGSAHRKSNDYKKAAAAFDMEGAGFKAAGSRIISEANNFLASLGSLAQKPSAP